ncbi:MinD/ParA family protein [Bacillus sp. ISL-47]|uniref:MinD/ParA family protein n=1 Tax=Bacillus sp. ISL-47 TaxID=2819130 RepID=UPI001BE97128|nr:MinD/ParA family protein [Bacillus sp. ISL-47]MBT2688576.1 MinD/ParA family protein [Bacillus sp. ISL-47]MBT2708874.1 MinD/ParA family protein [Pseudomonas sp. ISL-84]
MNDQAEKLRARLLEESSKRPMSKTIAVVSGKGGVGKSNFSLNFSISLCQKGDKVLLFDMDIGMGNLDILMGRTSTYSIADFFEKNRSLNDIVAEGPNGLRYIAGGTGLSHIVKLEDEQISRFTEELAALMGNYDYVIFDMGAGITEESARFILSVQEIAVITTPEPTSITDAYSAMKQIHLLDDSIPFYIVLNRAQGEKEGQDTFKRLSDVLKRFLGRESFLLGILPDDRYIQQAVKRQIPFILYHEKSPAAKAIQHMADKMGCRPADSAAGKNHSYQFISKLKKFLFERQ